MTTETINAAELNVGEYVGTGIPIVCCGIEMAFEGDADGTDWACLNCSLTVITRGGVIVPADQEG